MWSLCCTGHCDRNSESPWFILERAWDFRFHSNWFLGNLHFTKKLRSYIAQCPVLLTVQSTFTLYVPSRPVQSNTVSTSLGSIQPYATITARRLLVYISTTVYSQVFIYAADKLEQCRVKQLAQCFNTTAQDSNPGPLSRESEVLPMIHCALLTHNMLLLYDYST